MQSYQIIRFYLGIRISIFSIIAFFLVFGSSMDAQTESNTEINPLGTDENIYFVGGQNTLKHIIDSILVYPEEAKNKKIQGTVYVRAVVDKSGRILQAKVVRSVHPILDKEAIRVVKAIPKWQPAKMRDDVESVTYLLPIQFNIIERTSAFMQRSNRYELIIRIKENKLTIDDNEELYTLVEGEDLLRQKLLGYDVVRMTLFFDDFNAGQGFLKAIQTYVGDHFEIDKLYDRVTFKINCESVDEAQIEHFNLNLMLVNFLGERNITNSDEQIFLRSDAQPPFVFVNIILNKDTYPLIIDLIEYTSQKNGETVFQFGRIYDKKETEFD